MATKKGDIFFHPVGYQKPIQTLTTEQREEDVGANASNTNDSNSNVSVDNTNDSNGFANAIGADTNASHAVAEQPPQTRYPSRNRKPPTRLGFDWITFVLAKYSN